MRTRPSPKERESSNRPAPRSSQIEFGFSSSFRRPVSRPASAAPALVRPPRRRRGTAPATRRLAISPEAFAGSDGDVGRRHGLVEAGVAILATMAFGLGWAAYESDRAAPATASPGSSGAGYAVAPALATAGVEDAEWATDSFFATTESSSTR